jgi:hypothetical protein
MEEQGRIVRKQRQRENAVRRVMVPGFPEIIDRVTTCRLCGLIDDAPLLLRWIHDQWVSGAGVRALETASKARWIERGETPLDHRCFGRHFEGHVSRSALIAEVDEVLSSVDVAEARREAAAVTDAVDREIFGDDNSDFFDMKDVIARMKKWVRRFDDDEQLKGDDGRLDTFRLMAMLKLSSELRSSIETYNRMKNTDRISKAMLQGHTKRYVQHISEPLTTELLALRASIESGDVDDATARLDALLHERIGLIMRESAETSVKESCEVFRLN